MKSMAHVKKPKVQIKRQKVSLGWTYRIQIDGAYMADFRNGGQSIDVDTNTAPDATCGRDSVPHQG